MSLADIASTEIVQPEHGALRKHLPVAKIFHWVAAVLIFLMFATGVMMTQIGYTPFGNLLFATHKLLGASVLVLLSVRLIYRFQARLRGLWAPQAGGHNVHRLLYALGLAVPLLGWAGISDFGARETLFGIHLPKIWPEGLGYDGVLFSAHAWLAFLLIAVVVVHIAVALQDYILRGNAGTIDADPGL